MFIGMCYCDWKCCKEGEIDISVCQNSPLSQQPDINVEDIILIKRYLDNIITQSIVIGGLEPFLQFSEIINFISIFRNYSDDTIIIYTGYYKNEIIEKLDKLKCFKNIIIKYGRFKPNSPTRFDKILGISLISDNQYAERIS